MTLRTRGMNLGAARAFAKERFQEEGWQRLLARVPRKDVDEVWETLILPTGWYDYDVHARFLDALDEEFRAAEPNLGRELGRRAAQQDIRFYHSQKMSFDDPGRVLDQCARLWAEHYSEGRLEVEQRGTNSRKIILTNPGVHSMVCAESVPGWGEQAILLAGAQAARVEHVLCVRKGYSHCEYVAEWSQ